MSSKSSTSEFDNKFGVLCLGDVVGRPGRDAVRAAVPLLKQRHQIDLVIVNGENAAGGLGIDISTACELRESGADVVTLGDHTWKNREIRDFLIRERGWCIRPMNFAADSPGAGFTTMERGGVKVGVVNLIGRVFSPLLLECPFRAVNSALDSGLNDCQIIVCDMHAEATSEKNSMGRFLDGRVSLVFGTHTHIQTADEQILPRGTGYITDIGMCGVTSGVIGMDAATAIERFYSGLPVAYKLAKADSAKSICVKGVLAYLDRDSGRACSIERICVPLE